MMNDLQCMRWTLFWKFWKFWNFWRWAFDSRKDIRADSDGLLNFREIMGRFENFIL